MSGKGHKRCMVAYATRERQYLWAVDVPIGATIADVIEAARQLADEPDVPWDSAPVGIFGEQRARSDVPMEGDRVEIYRPLQTDPRDRRRQSVQRQPRSMGRSKPPR
jgi:putative ubiquitin-RnfH superfamily antitoxin RatB of RatAB toxin-antitoxin module